MSELKEKIVGVAIYMGDEIHALPQPLRHHNIIHFLAARGYPKPIVGLQGFITNKNRFVSREVAMHVAIGAEQVKEGETIHTRELFSEDLWK